MLKIFLNPILIQKYFSVTEDKHLNTRVTLTIRKIRKIADKNNKYFP